jgi:hypothetical protein
MMTLMMVVEALSFPGCNGHTNKHPWERRAGFPGPGKPLGISSSLRFLVLLSLPGLSSGEKRVSWRLYRLGSD